MRKSLLSFALMMTTAMTVCPIHDVYGVHAARQNSGLDRAREIFASRYFINEVVRIKFSNKTYLVRLINNPEGKPLQAGFLTIKSYFIIAPQSSLPDALIKTLKGFAGDSGISYLDAIFNGKRPFDLLAKAT